MIKLLISTRVFLVFKRFFASPSTRLLVSSQISRDLNTICKREGSGGRNRGASEIRNSAEAAWIPYANGNWTRMAELSTKLQAGPSSRKLVPATILARDNAPFRALSR